MFIRFVNMNFLKQKYCGKLRKKQNSEVNSISEKNLVTIPIVYVFDENYAAYSCVSAISALQHATEDIVFHAVTDHTDDQAEKIFMDELNAHGQTVKTYKANLGAEFVAGRISSSAYLKLSVPNLVEEKKSYMLTAIPYLKIAPQRLSESIWKIMF